MAGEYGGGTCTTVKRYRQRFLLYSGRWVFFNTQNRRMLGHSQHVDVAWGVRLGRDLSEYLSVPRRTETRLKFG